MQFIGWLNISTWLEIRETELNINVWLFLPYINNKKSYLFMRYLSLLQCTKASITWYSLSAWMSDIVVIKTKENVRWIKWILRWRWNNIFYKQAYLNSSRIHTVLNTCIMDMRITFGSYGGLLVSRFRTIWYLRLVF